MDKDKDNVPAGAIEDSDTQQAMPSAVDISDNAQTANKLQPVNLAAIDIGSNAARIPIRLGMDVFSKGMISDKREKMLVRTMKIFRQLMILYNVDDYRICATSAFRDAGNSKKILRYVKNHTKLAIDIISGTEEARIIRDNYPSQGNALYMDVGGGSTELSLVCDGELTDMRSFDTSGLPK